jgi:hypothetical protein
MAKQTLFDCPRDDIDYNLVDAFLGEGHREGIRIEYKEPTQGTARAIPDSALAAITSMSNSVGGIILVGVADNENLPITGSWPSLPRLHGRADQEDVMASKIAAQIMPRPTVEVRFVAPQSAPDVGILVVRVQPGPCPPYWCAGKGILARIGDQDRIADLSTIEHLFERRSGVEYAQERASHANWFQPTSTTQAITPVDVEVVFGPVDSAPRPALSATLDTKAEELFASPQLPFWERVTRTYQVAYGEDFTKLILRTDESGPNTYEVLA